MLLDINHYYTDLSVIRYMYVYICLYIYIYIYKGKERRRERERDRDREKERERYQVSCVNRNFVKLIIKVIVMLVILF